MRFIDWLIRLPKPLELALRQELTELAEQTKMSYVTSWEQFAREGGVALGIERGIEKGIDKGRQEGRQQGEAEALLCLLEAKFGLLPAALTARVRAASTDQLERWLPRVLTAVSLDQVLGSA